MRALIPLLTLTMALSGCVTKQAPEDPGLTGSNELTGQFGEDDTGTNLGGPGVTGPEDTGTGANGQFGEEDSGSTWEGGCVLTSASPLALDEATELGVTAGDLVDFVEGAWSSTFSWSDGSESTGLTQTVTYIKDSASWRTYEYRSGDVDSGTVLDTAALCPSAIGLVLGISFVTDDGSFAESWELDVEVWEADAITYSAKANSIDGTYAFDGQLTFTNLFAEGGSEGMIVLETTTTSSGGDTGSDDGITQDLQTLAWW